MDQAKLERFPKQPLWDPPTTQTINKLRAFLHRVPQPTISYIQEQSLKARPPKGPFSVFQTTLPVPRQDDVRQLLLQTIREMGEAQFVAPALESVPVEWTVKHSPTGATGGCESLGTVLRQAATDLTMLHVHGGGYLYESLPLSITPLDAADQEAWHSQGSPAVYRPTTTQLASLTGGRVVSVEYRLAPQHPFPASILDVLVAYLSLLYPAPSSPYPALDPARIVFAGDSVGGVLLFALLQIIGHTASRTCPLPFHDHQLRFPLPYPASIATLSFAPDQLCSLPSYQDNRVNDLYLEIPWALPDYPSCELWPTSPPRSQLYAETRSYLHPLISPNFARSCEGMPPMWFAVGEEQFVDGANAIARRAEGQGVSVTWVQFEALPHCFATLPGLNRSPQVGMCFRRWAEFCKRSVEERVAVTAREKQRSRATRIGYRDLKEEVITLDGGPERRHLPLVEVERLIRVKVDELESQYVAPKL